jgi:hypothetical protein
MTSAPLTARCNNPPAYGSPGGSLLPFEGGRNGSGSGWHPIGERYASGLVRAVAPSAAMAIVAQAENSH